MSVDFEWQGKAMVDMLFQRIEEYGTVPPALIKRPELVIRESTQRFGAK